MRLYQFNLPHHTNDVQHNYAAERMEWCKRAVSLTGSCNTLGDAFGQWQDGAKLYREHMHIYQVAGSPQDAQMLLADAFKLFPDQKAIFYAEIGTANIVARNA